jgi:hypothetical protein
VKAYGLQVLRERYRRQEATQMQYSNPEDPDNLKDYEGTISTLTRQTMPRIKFPDSKPSKEYLLRLEIPEKKAYALGRKILKSARSEKEFWDESKELHAHNDVINTLANQKPFTETEARLLAFSIPPSILFHWDAIGSLLNSEEINDTVYPERRQNLLRWNRGIRHLMGQLRNRFLQNSNLCQTLETNLTELEYCRMRISAPDNTPSGLGEQFSEFERLQNAQKYFERGDILECLAQCNRLTDLRTSLFGTACARIISAQLKTTVLLQSRKMALQLGYDALENLRRGIDLSSCQPEWAHLIDGWMHKAKLIAQEIAKEETAVAAAVASASNGN